MIFLFFQVVNDKIMHRNSILDQFVYNPKYEQMHQLHLDFVLHSIQTKVWDFFFKNVLFSR